jgi:hypothetical protein
MAQYGGRGKGVVAVDEVQIAMANAARDGAYENFAIQRLVDLDIFDNQGLLGTIENGGFHRRNPPENFRGEPWTRGATLGGCAGSLTEFCWILLLLDAAGLDSAGRP